ncbi:MAG: class I SAM-dependent methyltransferase [Gemmatimonadaceae bacterium]
MTNLDAATIAGFGDEWSRFDQSALSDEERRRIFEDYFAVFPWERVGASSVGADVGCGSGRWALLMAPKVGLLHCVDPSDAIDIAAKNCGALRNVQFHKAAADNLPFEDGTLDFAYSLGVLHHVPDTAAAIRAVSRKLKRGAPFLLYLYYAFDNRPAWYRWVWRVSDLMRRAVSRLPPTLRYVISQLIAATVYWPLARLAKAADRQGLLGASFPLAAYRDKSFYTMRTDALDRFGTRLERRFSRREIEVMLRAAGCGQIRFSERAPFWCAVGIKE